MAAGRPATSAWPTCPSAARWIWSFPVSVHDVVMMGRIGKMGLFRWPGRRDHRAVQAALADVDMTELC